jgi:enamine deaminase RidA (YjgF/YER057c/UK114 family)
VRERTDMLANILDAIGKDISQIETDELLLDKHRKKMEEIERLKARLAERHLMAPRGPFV